MVTKFNILLNILNMAKFAMKDENLWKDELSEIEKLKEFIYEEPELFFEIKGSDPF